jgi:hypothetical protein
MNNHSDKLLLFLALLVCATGFGATAWLHQDAGKEKPEKKENNQALRVYEPISLPPLPLALGAWTEPVRADDEEEDEFALWAYDLFTPVQIYWNNSSKEYYPKGLPNEPEPPFGIKLLSMTRPVYRFTLSGEGPGKTALLADSEFYDENEKTRRGTMWRVKKGSVLKKADIDLKVLSFDVTRQRNDNDGTVTLNRVLVVHDNKLNREFRLREGVPHEFTERTNIEIARSDNPAEKWMWKQAGDQIKLENIGTFVLKEFDFDAKTVTVEKTYEKANKTNTKKVQKKQVETLQVEQPLQQKPTNAERHNQPTVTHPSTSATNP